MSSVTLVLIMNVTTFFTFSCLFLVFNHEFNFCMIANMKVDLCF